MDRSLPSNAILPSPTCPHCASESHSSLDRRGSTDPVSAEDGGFLRTISNNPFFTGGVGLAGIGAALALFQKGVRRGAGLLHRRLLVDVEVNIKDETYPWLLYWMTAHLRSQVPSKKPGLKQSLGRLFAPRMHHLALDTQKVQHSNGLVQTKQIMVPGPGRHLLRYENNFVLVNRVRETKSMDFQRGTPWETINLTTLYSSRHIFEQIFQEANQLAQQSREGKTIIYTPRTASWEGYGEPQKKRSLESVILDKGVKERIVQDVRSFLENQKWYYDRNVPYRRGYLLHGPPGTGKTSFIKALAGDLDYNIAMLNLGERGMTDERLGYLLTVVPPRTLVLLEDADAAFNGRAQNDGPGYRSSLTFSGLLNALDGIASAEERLMFLTTNHLERFDKALVRPGRVDMMVRIGEVTRWQAERLWSRFYGELDAEGILRAQFLQRLEQIGLIESEVGKRHDHGGSTSAAALQGLFLYNKDDPEGAISMATSHLTMDRFDEGAPAAETPLL